ncbi:SpoIIIAH-like family protein [Pelosinus sp. sgz500959]|uniref:SpoIIIAH-like family protein n=1 Tax=Pelosinus sp. sgz500959 TaxID=3242472 RepID=UPI00366D6FFF
MKILMIRMINKNKIILFGIMIVIALLVGIWGHSSFLQARVDHSTAMQVTKSVAAEQVIPVSSPDFFTEYRLEREKIRSERSDLLRDSIKNAKNDEARIHAQDIVLKMMTEKQKEAEMESLIRGKGFADSLVFIRENSVSAIIKATSLSREEVVQVADLINRVSGVKLENISISAKP